MRDYPPKPDATLSLWQNSPPRSWRVTAWSTAFYAIVAGVAFLIFAAPLENKYLAVMHVSVFLILLVLSGFDVRHRILPDILTISLVLIGFLWNSYLGFAVWISVLSAVLGFGVFWLLNEVWKRRTGSTGIGLGDAKLLAGGGALLGANLLPITILLSSGAALLFVLISRIANGEQSAQNLVTFGPFISISIWVLWCVAN